MILIYNQSSSGVLRAVLCAYNTFCQSELDQLVRTCLVVLSSSVVFNRREKKLFAQFQKTAKEVPDKKEREEIEALKTQVLTDDVFWFILFLGGAVCMAHR